MWVTTLWCEQFTAVQWAAVLVGALVGVVMHLRARRVPNWMSLPKWDHAAPSALVVPCGKTIVLGIMVSAVGMMR